jgi:predicted secreted protein
MISLGTGVAVYFLIWWLTFFAVLPFGVTSQHEAETTPGTDPGAPVLPKLLMKIVWTTLISGVIYLLLYVVYAYRLIGLDDIPWLPRP